MKSYFLLLSAVMLLFVSCGSGTPRVQTDLEVANVHGEVESIEQGSRRVYYNRQGYITDTYHIGQGEPMQLSKIVYDQSGVQPIEIMNFKYFDNASSPTIERVELTDEQSASRGVPQAGCKYNKAGNLEVRNFYVDPKDDMYVYYKDRPEYISKYFYNEQEQLIELQSMQYGPRVENGEIDNDSYVLVSTSVSRYEYNEQGYVSGATTTLDNGKVLSYTYTYEYDQRGNWIQKSVNEGEPIVRKIHYYEE